MLICTTSYLSINLEVYPLFPGTPTRDFGTDPSSLRRPAAPLSRPMKRTRPPERRKRSGWPPRRRTRRGSSFRRGTGTTTAEGRAREAITRMDRYVSVPPHHVLGNWEAMMRTVNCDMTYEICSSKSDLFGLRERHGRASAVEQTGLSPSLHFC